MVVTEINQSIGSGTTAAVQVLLADENDGGAQTSIYCIVFHNYHTVRGKLRVYPDIPVLTICSV